MKLTYTLLCILSIIISISASIESEYDYHGQISSDYFNSRRFSSSLNDNISDNDSYGFSNVRGIDFDDAHTLPELKCIKNRQYTFIIASGYQYTGRVDPNMRTNVNSAHTAGFKNVDVSMYPCVSCGNPAGQANSLWEAFQGIRTVGMIWISVESPEKWSDNKTNRAFFESLLRQLSLIEARVGIHTSEYAWNKIFGDDYTVAKSYPIWYNSAASVASFEDWKPFGGWKTPSIKQYNQSVIVCDVKVNISVY